MRLGTVLIDSKPTLIAAVDEARAVLPRVFRHAGSPVAPPAAFSNNHLGYALTWFGLAITLVVFYAALLLRRYRPTPSKDC